VVSGPVKVPDRAELCDTGWCASQRVFEAFVAIGCRRFAVLVAVNQNRVSDLLARLRGVAYLQPECPLLAPVGRASGEPGRMGQLRRRPRTAVRSRIAQAIGPPRISAARR
jgi:hypothetical protein